MIAIAAFAFASFAAVVVLFQLALVAGAPWGSLTQGGAHPGRLPARSRAVAGASAVLVTAFAIAVLARAGAAFPALRSASHVAVWVVVAFSTLTVLRTPPAAAGRARRVASRRAGAVGDEPRGGVGSR